MTNLTPYEKKQYLMQKYVKRDYKVEDIESCKQFALYFNPAIDKIKEWTFMCVCNTIEECKQQILWRKKYMETNDGDLVIDNDKNFSTWRDETKNVDHNGNTYEPGQELMNIDYNTSGNMLQVIANSAPQVPQQNGFKGTAHYLNIEIGNYEGYYKIEEIYKI